MWLADALTGHQRSSAQTSVQNTLFFRVELFRFMPSTKRAGTRAQCRNVVNSRAEIVYDDTVRFCSPFLNSRDGTVDQMIQEARPSKQNVIGGSTASAISKETEIKRTNVARASLEELLAGHRDFLRVTGLDELPHGKPGTGDRAAERRSVSRAASHTLALRRYPALLLWCLGLVSAKT